MSVPVEQSRMAGVAEGDTICRPGLIAWGHGMPPESSMSLLKEGLTSLASGGSHSAVVCASGRVYTFGRVNYYGWMKKDTINEPTLVPSLASVKITQAACGWGSTYFLSDKGELYSAGCNDCGQLGLGNTTDSPTPVLVRGLPVGHTVVLTERGEVWVCGANGHGQLGLGNDNRTSFTRVPDLTVPIIDVSCSGHFTALLTASQSLMMAGWNEYNQLGLSGVKSSSRFQSVSLPSTAIAAVACGTYHTVALAVDGSVWAWGANDKCQLGIGNTCQKSLPSRVMGLEGHTISSVFAGCQHTALLTQQGDVFVCGRGWSGELGPGRADISVPSLLKKSPGLLVQQVVFGDKYSLLMVSLQPSSPPSALKQETVGTHNEYQARSCVTELERTIMKSLECPVCFKIMCAPIHQCCNGHSLCGSCYSSQNIQNCPTCRGQFIPTRSICSENISAGVELPCSDCLLRMPVASLEAHASECPMRQYRCPLQQTCGWSGRPEAMLAHASSAHPQQTCQDLPHTFSHSLRDQVLHTTLLSAHEELFTLHRRSTSTANEAQFAVRYIGLPEDATKFRFRIEFNEVDEHLCVMFCKKVCCDTEVDTDLFKLRHCVLMKSDELDSCAPKDILSCKVNILIVN